MKMARMIIQVPQPLKDKLNSLKKGGLHGKWLYSQFVRARTQPTKPQGAKRTVEHD
jgi:hypothetical protein